MSDLSARGLLECFHRYLDAEARSLDEVAPGVYEFCGAQVRAEDSAIDVACGTYIHCGPGADYEIVTGRLLSIDLAVVDARDVDDVDDVDRRVVRFADGDIVRLPASPSIDRCIDDARNHRAGHDRRFELCATQLEP